MDGIDSSGRVPIIPPDQNLISDHVREKGGQSRPHYFAQKRKPAEPQPEELVEEETPAPEEPGKPKHHIDIKV